MVNPVVKFSFTAILVAADIFLLILDCWVSNVKGPPLYLPMSHQMFGIADLDHLRISRKKKNQKIAFLILKQKLERLSFPIVCDKSKHESLLVIATGRTSPTGMDTGNMKYSDRETVYIYTALPHSKPW